MNLLEAFILGFVQGATEFLPVSSSGHLVMGQALMGITIPGVSFEVAVHVATLLSVLIVYRSRLAGLARGAVTLDVPSLRYLGLLLVATVPAAVVGLTLGDRLERLFEAPAVAGWALLVTGLFLWTTRWALARELGGSAGVMIALLVGLAQCLALVPGISRSGATVVAGLWLGMEAEEAAAFSFLMAIPAILGAAVLETPEALERGLAVAPGALLLGSLVAAVVGVLAIRLFVHMLRQKSFYRFAPYCWVAGGAFLLYLQMKGS